MVTRLKLCLIDEAPYTQTNELIRPIDTVPKDLIAIDKPSTKEKHKDKQKQKQKDKQKDKTSTKTKEQPSNIKKQKQEEEQEEKPSKKRKERPSNINKQKQKEKPSNKQKERPFKKRKVDVEVDTIDVSKDAIDVVKEVIVVSPKKKDRSITLTQLVDDNNGVDNESQRPIKKAKVVHPSTDMQEQLLLDKAHIIKTWAEQACNRDFSNIHFKIVNTDTLNDTNRADVIDSHSTDVILLNREGLTSTDRLCREVCTAIALTFGQRQTTEFENALIDLLTFMANKAFNSQTHIGS